MSSPNFLPSLRDSETVTCPRCSASQFPRNGTCIRCQTPLGLDYLSLEISSLLDPCSEDHKKQIARGIGMLLRTLRSRRGFCQSQLVVRAAGCITRSNLSRAECGRTLLPLNKLLPIARALGLKAVILRFEVATPRSAHPSGDRG
jgi:transcriptional regulator with XRE-family HTH domain